MITAMASRRGLADEPGDLFKSEATPEMSHENFAFILGQGLHGRRCRLSIDTQTVGGRMEPAFDLPGGLDFVRPPTCIRFRLVDRSIPYHPKQPRHRVIGPARHGRQPKECGLNDILRSGTPLPCVEHKHRSMALETD